MRRGFYILRSNRGQNILEYALIASIIAAAAVAMSTYVFRAVQGAQQSIQAESLK